MTTSPKDAVKAVPRAWMHKTNHAVISNGVIEDVRKRSGMWEPLYGPEVMRKVYAHVSKLCNETAAEYGRMAIGSNTGQYDHMQNAAEQLATEFAELAEE